MMKSVWLVDSVSAHDVVRAFLLHVKEQTRQRIEQLKLPTESHSAATRDTLMADWDRTDGIVFFAHGDINRLVAHDNTDLFTVYDVARLDARWCHAFACRTAENAVGNSPASHAAARAEVYAGYAGEIQALIHFERFSPALLETVTDLTCTLSLQLAMGERSERELRTEVTRAWSKVMDALETDPSIDPFTLLSLSQFVDLFRTQLRLVGVGLR
jgi:hypothetical protein